MDYIIYGKCLKHFQSSPAIAKEEIAIFGDDLVEVCDQKTAELLERFQLLERKKEAMRELISIVNEYNLISEDTKDFLDVMKAVSIDAEQKVIKRWIKYWYIVKHKAQKIPITVLGGISDEDIEEANKVPFEMVFQGRLKHIGNKHIGLCPFHKEKTASFTIFDKDNHAKCFGCDWHGSVIDYVMETQEMGFVEAVKNLLTF